MNKENELVEQLSEKVHKAYCVYCKEVKGKEYWTKGDYSKLTEVVKEADRYTVRAVLEALKQVGYFDLAIQTFLNQGFEGSKDTQ